MTGNSACALSNGRSGGPIRRILQAIEPRSSSAFSFSRGALENLRLDIELFTTDQIELCQSAGEQRTRIFLDVGGWTGRNEGAQTSAEIFKEFRVEHGSHRAAQVVAGSVEFSTAQGARQVAHQSGAKSREAALSECRITCQAAPAGNTILIYREKSPGTERAA
jgi:hypothetical protein